MPAVLIEAGLMGLPAVATPIEGIVDIVLDGQTGRLVPVDDPAGTAKAVVQVGERATEYGTVARAHCLEHFEIDRIAERWQGVIDEVLER